MNRGLLVVVLAIGLGCSNGGTPGGVRVDSGGMGGGGAGGTTGQGGAGGGGAGGTTGQGGAGGTTGQGGAGGTAGQAGAGGTVGGDAGPDSAPDGAPSCPGQQPQDGRDCGGTTLVCQYGHTSCCGISYSMTTCRCQPGGFSCATTIDCNFVCPDAGGGN